MIIILGFLIVGFFVLPYIFIEKNFSGDEEKRLSEYYLIFFVLFGGLIFGITLIGVLLKFSKEFLFKDIRLVDKSLKNQIKQIQKELNTLS